jgi:hypothetical protein
MHRPVPKTLGSGAPSAIRPQSIARPAAFTTGVSQLFALSAIVPSVPLRLLCGRARHGEKLSRHRGARALALCTRPHLRQTGRGGSSTLWPEGPLHRYTYVRQVRPGEAATRTHRSIAAEQTARRFVQRFLKYKVRDDVPHSHWPYAECTRPLTILGGPFSGPLRNFAVCWRVCFFSLFSSRSCRTLWCTLAVCVLFGVGLSVPPLRF